METACSLISDGVFSPPPTVPSGFPGLPGNCWCVISIYYPGGRQFPVWMICVSMLKRFIQIQEYNHKTTFSSVCIDRDGDILNLHIANGGDSMVMVINTETKAVVYQTVVDMNFAGRSIMEAAVQTISLSDDVYRVVLATDGYADLIKELDRSVGGALQEILFSVPVHEVADRLLNELDMLNEGIEYDDVGFVIFNPFHLHEYCPMSIISGGTTSREEKLFNKSSIGDVPDEWHETGYWQENEEIIKTAGIGFYWDGNRS